MHTVTNLLSIESEVSVWQVYCSFGLGPADSAQLHKVVTVSPDYCIDLLKRYRKVSRCIIPISPPLPSRFGISPYRASPNPTIVV